MFTNQRQPQQLTQSDIRLGKKTIVLNDQKSISNIQKILDINQKKIITEKYWGIEEGGLIYIQFSVKNKNNYMLNYLMLASTFILNFKFSDNRLCKYFLNYEKVSQNYLQT